MKLATLRAAGATGRWSWSRATAARFATASAIAPTLQAALDDWDARRAGAARARRRARARRGRRRSRSTARARARRCRAPTSGSTARRSSTTSILVRKARGAEPPETLRDRSARLPGRLGRPARPARRHRARTIAAWGLDFEREVCVDPRRHAARHDAPPTPRRTSASCCSPTTSRCATSSPTSSPRASASSSRKPATAFSPFAVTPDELGDAWRDGRAAPARCARRYNGAARRRPRRRPRDALLVLRSRSRTSRKTRALHRRHDPRQRHGVERRSRARRLVPRRAAHDRDHRAAASPTTPFMTVGDTHRDRDARRRRRAASSARIEQRVVRTREARTLQLLALVGALARAHRARPQGRSRSSTSPVQHRRQRRAARRRRTARCNPMAQVPTLESPTTTARRALAQSLAILEYLEERFPAPPLLAARSATCARARAQLAEIVNSGIQPLQNLPTHRSAVKELGGDAEAWARRFIARGLAALERCAPRRPPARFCVGDAPTHRRRAAWSRSSTSARRFGVDSARCPLLARDRSSAASRCPRSHAAHARPPTRRGQKSGRTPWPSSSLSASSASKRSTTTCTTSSASRRFFVDKLDFAEIGAVVAGARARGAAALGGASRPATSLFVMLPAASARAAAPGASCASTPTASARSCFEVEDIERDVRAARRARRHVDHRHPALHGRRRHAGDVLDHHAVRRHHVPLRRARAATARSSRASSPHAAAGRRQQPRSASRRSTT